MALSRGSRAVTLLWVAAGGYLLWGFVVGTMSAVDQWGWLGFGVNLVLHAVAVSSGLVVLGRGRRTDNVVPLAVVALVGLVLHGLVPYAGLSIVFLVIVLVPLRLRLWQAALFTIATTGGFVLVSLYTELPTDAMFGITAGLGWAMFFAAVFDQLAAARRRTDAVAAAKAREAVLAERQRMAREIHDIIAHSLSGQILHLEGTRLLLETGGDVTTAIERVTRASELAREGLDETKRAVTALRGDDAPLAQQLDRIAEQFRDGTGRRCDVDVPGGALELAPEARLAVVRTAQEALTNVRKHAPNSGVTMRLLSGSAWWELEVRDDGGTDGTPADTNHGYGLVGMRERAELIGGSLDAGPDGTGFLVRLRVPA